MSFEKHASSSSGEHLVRGQVEGNENVGDDTEKSIVVGETVGPRVWSVVDVRREADGCFGKAHGAKGHVVVSNLNDLKIVAILGVRSEELVEAAVPE